MTISGSNFVNSLTDDKCDPKMGELVYSHLIAKNLDWRRTYAPEAAYEAFELGVKTAFRALGYDPNDPSTKDTPKRFACMAVGELTKGLDYAHFPKCTTTPNGGQAQHGGYNQMVLVRDIQIMSLCEHHLQTIDGVCHIAYIPSEKVLGLSKFARVADFFARRPQIQERLTEQIFEALVYILGTQDVAVVIDAEHYCMKARGAMQSSARTQTDKMGGRFMDKAPLREELFNAIR